MSKPRCAFLLTLLLAVTWLSPGATRAQESANHVRGMFLLLLGKYVTWPATAFDSPSAPLVISIVGNPSLASEMQAQAAGQSIDGHAIEVRATADTAGAGGSHIVFVTTAEDARLLASSSPLRVSEEPDRIDDTDIAIRMQSGRVAFAVNRRAVVKRGLKLSSKLMNLASDYE
jgi:hypothetical protein